MSVQRLLIWRHGRTSWNAQRRYQGQADPPLDEVGHRQAHQAAALLASFAPDLIVSSDLQRAAQTAGALALRTGAPVHLDARLRERSLGHWEGLTREEVQVAYPDEFAEWSAGREVSRSGGETREQVADRAYELFRQLPDVTTVVLVTHSATALALSGAVLRLRHDRHVLGPLANCHWSELLAHEGQYRLRSHNAGPAGAVIPLAPDAAPDAVEVDPPDAEAMDAAAR